MKKIEDRRPRASHMQKAGRRWGESKLHRSCHRWGILNQNDYNPLVRGSRGFSLVEVLAGLLILSLVVTTSLAVFYHRERTLVRAEESMLAWQVLRNESEIIRRIPWAQLDALHAQPFQSDLAVLSSLEGVSSRVEVGEGRPRVKDLTLTLSWRGGEQTASVTVLRSDTGGANLW